MQNLAFKLFNLDFKDKNGYNMTYKVDAKESIIKWIHL